MSEEMHVDAMAVGEHEAAGSIESLAVRQALDGLRSEQSLVGGVVGGALGALLGAAAWAGVTVGTGYQIGWMAVGVGFLAGFGTRLLGKGLDNIFGVLGAGLALLGCLAGNLLAVVGLASKELEVGYLELFTQLGPASAVELMTMTFSPMDLLFYGIALYEGYKFSFRQVTPAELGLPEPEP